MANWLPSFGLVQEPCPETVCLASPRAWHNGHVTKFGDTAIHCVRPARDILIRMLLLFQGDPDLYQQYHEGFRQQTAGWPRQPVDVAIDWLRGKPAGWRVADFGCGDARLARTVQQVHAQ